VIPGQTGSDPSGFGDEAMPVHEATRHYRLADGRHQVIDLIGEYVS
jgi:hypothetical protein